jgi:soluble lytic murein transglycosylase-like protein
MQRLRFLISNTVRFVKMISLMTVVVLICFLCLDVHNQQINNLDYLSQVVKVDPRIKYIAMYQKARYSKTPRELADIQAKLIIKVAEEENVAVEMLVALADQESYFDPRATSFAGATGLVQILTEAHITIDEDQRYDIEYNLRIGCKILKWKAKRTGGKIKDETLSAYSGGANDYANKIYERMGRYVTFVDNLKEAQKVIAQN